MRKMETTRIEGTVQNIIFQNPDNGYTIAEIIYSGGVLTVVGGMPLLCMGEILTADGNFIHHQNYGKQFSVESYSSELPSNVEGIRLYLSGGLIRGIGPVLAGRITEAFGNETFEVLCTDPKRLSKVKGINLEKAKSICNEFNRQFGLREAIVQLTALGINATIAIQAYNTYGATVTDLVAQNPYILCNTPVLMDFTVADKIADDFSFDRYGDERLVAGLYHVVRHNNSNGHCCVPKEKLIDTVSAFLAVEDERVAQILRLEEDCGKIVNIIVNNISYIYLPEFYKAETEIAKRLLDLVHRKALYIDDLDKRVAQLEQLHGFEYEKLQKSAIKGALNCGVFILTGGPGTGKTTTVKAIISLLENSAQITALVAPTGRAAKRMTELCGRDATTIHRLLEVNFSNSEEITFVHNENKPLKVDVVIVDEMSMVDIFLFNSLLRALPSHARLIMIGDHDQLPSVGPGNILKSIKESHKLPEVELKEVFRQSQSSLIVSNAHRIQRGEFPVCDNRTGDYFFLEQFGDKAQRTLLDLSSFRLPNKYGYDSMSDIQVLCATKVGPLGTQVLNPLLQGLLNPEDETKQQVSFADKIFRVGDKVMQTKNNYDLQYTKDGGFEGSGVFNGDIGYITAIDKRRNIITITMDDREYRYESEQLIELEHAYAITVHKSQGSEFSCVILPLTDIPKRLCYRNLLYTAVTRARELLVTIGDRSVVADMLVDNKSSLRYSMLERFLCEDN